ncbi:MAG: hypothetical protein ABEH80_01940 [Halobaculum sp.]
MGFGTPPAHRNPTYDTDVDGDADSLDETRLQETAIAVQFVMGGPL